MTIADFQVHLESGPGVVSCVRNVTLVVVPTAEQQLAGVETVLELVRAEDAAAKDAFASLSTRLVDLLRRSAMAQRVPPFGVFVTGDSDVGVFLFGPVVASITTGTRVFRLSGEHAVLGLQVVLPGRPEGVVVASAAPPEPRPMAPTGPFQPSSADDENHHVTVDGVRCTVGHFNDPAARYCASCGRLMAYADGVLTRGTRPALGALVDDGGTSVTVDRDVVIGWAPEVDRGVQDGRARPLAVADTAGDVALVHARLELHDWDVRLVDRGSPGGTFVAGPSHVDWSRLSPHTPTVIAPGTRIRIGSREFRFVSHDRI